MLLVISNPDPLPREAALLNELLAEGLEVLHLRKPNATVEELEQLLDQIKPDYHPQVALHQHHKLAAKHGLHRLHYPEALRKEQEEQERGEEVFAGKVLSTSLHHVEEHRKLPAGFAYAFLSPVYGSLSKPGYAATDPAQVRPPQSRERQTKLVALGGIDENNLLTALELGFDGVAVLGALWLEPEKSLQKFKRLQNLYR